MLPISKRSRELGTENAFVVLGEVAKLQAEGKDIVSFCIGQPDFPTPDHIRLAGIKAITEGKTGYTPSPGIPELRQSVARYFTRTRGVEVSPGSVLVGTGAKPFLFFTILATCNPGDEVVYPDPGFPIYQSAIRWAGATPVPLPLLESRDFSFDLDDLAARLGARTKLVVLNSPENPTGGVISPEVMAGAAELLAASNAWVLSDEVYSQMLYEGEFASVASYEGRAASFSGAEVRKKIGDDVPAPPASSAASARDDAMSGTVATSGYFERSAWPAASNSSRLGNGAS